MKKGVSIGQLRQRIVIEVPERLDDHMGGASVVWNSFATVWAKIEPMSANQVMWAQHLEHRVTHKIFIRQLDGLNAKMRVSFDSRYFHIKGFQRILEIDDLMELSCEEGAAA